MKKKIYLIFSFFIGCTILLQAQTHMYYAKAMISDTKIKVEKQKDGTLVYKGSNSGLKSIFNQYDITKFEKSFPNENDNYLDAVFYIESSCPTLVKDISQRVNGIFDFVEYIGDSEDMLAHTPNDYGITGGSNSGYPADLTYLDFINLPDAFDYTTGSSDIKIGISDAKLAVNDADFVNKTLVLPSESQSIEGGHGTTTAAIAAAQGDNAHGATGVCYNCDIIKSRFNYDAIMDLHNAGAKIINCSWGSTFYSAVGDTIVQRVTRQGSIVVAASHNDAWSSFPGNRFRYPASFDNVISVGAVGSRNDLLEGVFTHPGDGSTRSSNVKDRLSAQIIFFGDPNDPNTTRVPVLQHTATLNSAVDIVAPGGRIFRYGRFLLDPNANAGSYYTGYNFTDDFQNSLHTSPSTPQVTGVLGLMLTVNGSLNFIEAESILKATSANIDDIPENQVFAGNYGSGSLNAGRAVKLTHDLQNPNANAAIGNQRFTRWDFVFNAISKNVYVRSQEFTEDATLEITAKNAITLLDETLLEPNSNGYAILQIDSNLVLQQSNTRAIAINTKKKKINDDIAYQIYPTLVDDKVFIEGKDRSISEIERIEIYNLNNEKMNVQSNQSLDKINIDVTDLKSGTYIIRGINSDDILFTEKIVKK